MAKKAVILMNLGGPDSLSAVEPFLFNLFYDPHIISLPNPFRWLAAHLISKRRKKVSLEIYKNLGGKSPILEETQRQARALEEELGPDWKVLIAMRYWKPRAEEIIKELEKEEIEEVVLLPLYPQYSTTTTLSSVMEWKSAEKNSPWKTRVVSSYPTLPGFISYFAHQINDQLKQQNTNVRILFSAHGLPEKIIKQQKDPYPKEVEKTVKAIVELLPRGIEYRLCYQSRVGPLEWIKPYADQEIQKAAEEGKFIVLVPISFVSEHSETLVEMDQEYFELAKTSGAAGFYRIKTPGDNLDFIKGLATLVRERE